MGWLVLLAAVPVVERAPAAGAQWLVAGGCLYTLGVVFFVLDARIRHAHAVWHGFVAAGTACHTRAVQRGLQLTLSGAGASGPWEAELVTMALTNLLDNAIDFSAAGSTVRIELEGATVAVQDSGPGVPDYALPRLGERFFTTARPGGERSGSGLGLAIVRRVMALHGGHMAVRNTQPGLRVVLEFPPAQTDSAHPAARPFSRSA